MQSVELCALSTLQSVALCCAMCAAMWQVCCRQRSIELM